MIKNDNMKSFQVKKLFDELPTIENLKKRNPKIYKVEYLCSRCKEQKETLSHL